MIHYWSLSNDNLFGCTKNDRYNEKWKIFEWDHAPTFPCTDQAAVYISISLYKYPRPGEATGVNCDMLDHSSLYRISIFERSIKTSRVRASQIQWEGVDLKDLHRGFISPIVYSFIYSCLPAWFFTSLQLYARLTECNKFKDANEPWTRKPLQMSDLEYCMTVLILKCYETCNNSCSLKLSLFFYAAKFSLNAAVMLTAQWIVHSVLDGQTGRTSLPSEFKIQQHHNYNIYSL